VNNPAPFDPNVLAQQRYLTSDEAAAYLRFPSRKAFLHWTYRQALPCCKRGRTSLYLRTDLEQRVERTLGRDVQPMRLVTRKKRLA
jgi:hypothetical protein